MTRKASDLKNTCCPFPPSLSFEDPSWSNSKTGKGLVFLVLQLTGCYLQCFDAVGWAAVKPRMVYVSGCPGKRPLNECSSSSTSTTDWVSLMVPESCQDSIIMQWGQGV